MGEDHFKIATNFDYASSSFDQFLDLEGSVKHTRVVFYVRGQFWVVVDNIETDRPRRIDALWHWHPENTVVKDRYTVKTLNERGNLTLVPVSRQNFDIQLIKGQETPEIQAWYSPEYNLYEPNTTSSYSCEIEGNFTLVWLLMPSDKESPNIKTKIISENKDGITLGVSVKEKKWLLNIPFYGSTDAAIEKSQ